MPPTKHFVRAAIFDLEGLCGGRHARGIEDVIGRLRARGVKVALSAGDQAAGTRPRFDVVVRRGGDGRYLAAAEELGVPAFHCVVFTDSAEGVSAAASARMKCIGVGSPERLAGAAEVVSDLREVDVDAVCDAGRARGLAPEPWTVAETRLEPARSRYWESVFALTNGYMGVRGTHEEDDELLRAHSRPGTFLNGIYGYELYHHACAFPGYPAHGHAMLNICDWRAVNLFIDGERFSFSKGEVLEYRRELNMRDGALVRYVLWESPAGRRVKIVTGRIVSMVRRHSAAVRYEVTPLDSDCRLRFESLTTSDVPSRLPGEQLVQVDRREGGMTPGFVLRTTSADFAVGVSVRQSIRPGRGECLKTTRRWDERRLAENIEVAAVKGDEVALEKHACFWTTRDGVAEGDLLDRACAGADETIEVGFERLFEEQKGFWRKWWDVADVEIRGSVRDQQAVRFALFHLRQSHPEEGTKSIGAGGQTGDGYRGHVFWDTEAYMAPCFLYTQPGLVRPLLMYRHGILDRARERARQMQGRGALFAWNSISGEECGVVFEASTAQYHLLADVARCMQSYVLATGDEAFLFDHGAEILFETARFLEDRGAYVPAKGGKFCLNAVCGPDEYACGVNNNCYTNMMTREHFRFAKQVHDRMAAERPGKLQALAERIGLEESEPAAWQRAADDMYVSFNEELGIHEQDDTFLGLDPVDMDRVPRNTDIRARMHPLNLWRMQVVKQADVVLLMFALGDRFSPEVKRRNYDFYEPKTCHGSSLSPSVHAILAAELGKLEEAYDYFRHSARMDLDDFKDNAAGGLHLAAMGGTWMAVVNGFAGMRDYERGLQFDPKLPAAWKGYRFGVTWRGRRIGVGVAREDGRHAVTYRLLSGDPVTLRSGGEEVRLAPESPEVTLGLGRPDETGGERPED